MFVYVDTSFVVALFTDEARTESSRELISGLQRRQAVFYTSSISPVEWTSAIWKKVRTGALSEQRATVIEEIISNWSEQFDQIDLSSHRLSGAKQLIRRYAQYNLRTLDAVQLSCALSITAENKVALTHDALLSACFRFEGFTVLP